MDLFYFLALVACAIQCRHIWRQLPVFTLSVVAAILFELTYRPFSGPWLVAWFPWLVAPLVAIRTIAVAEAFFWHSRWFPYRVQLCLSAGLLSLVFALIMIWRFSAQDALYAAIQIRRLAVVWSAAFLGVYALLMWSLGTWRGGLLGFHIFLLLALHTSMSVSGLLRMAYPTGIWYAVDPIAYGVAALIYLLWAWLFSTRCDRPDQLPAPTPH